MARWTDLATWRGNGKNQGPGGMVEHRGLVLHIAVGWYEGTIAWQRNPASDVSSHFVVGRERGELAQMVDTAVRAWTQGDGNGRWLSSENEGFPANDSRNPGSWERLSDWQIEANARLLAKAHQVYGVPLRVADHPGEKGLGHHSMDREWLDEQWGHDECPGAAIVAQKPAIASRAKAIVEEGDDMDQGDIVRHTDKNVAFHLRNTLRGVDQNTDHLAEVRATVRTLAGEDQATVIREELDRHRATLVAGLGETLAERVLAGLREQLGDVADERLVAAAEAGSRLALADVRLTVDEVSAGGP